MTKVSPPFKLDIAGAFCVPRALRDARGQYQDGQMSRQALRAIEDAEIRNLVERLKLAGVRVVSDGGFRNGDFLVNWEGIRAKDDRPFSEGAALEITRRIGLQQHPVFEDFTFLISVAGDEVVSKQHLPSPAEVMTQILQRVDRGELEAVYPDIRLLTDDIAAGYKVLLGQLYEAGCRYIQFDGVHSVVMEDTIRLNNRVLRECPEGMYIAFHAPTEMLIQLHGADAYFLNYDCGSCDRNRLLWFLHEKEAVFGFVLSRYSHEDELDELQAKTESVLNYIPLKRFTLCLPDANALASPSDADEKEQWETVRLGMLMAERIFS